jgi:hypothetical protein
MRPVSKRARGLHYEAVFEVHEMLCLKGHLWSQTPMGSDQSDLNIPLVNILPDNPIHLLLIRQEVTKTLQEHPKIT